MAVAHTSLSDSDRVEITELLYSYARLTDSWHGTEQDVVDMLILHTPDAVLEGPSGNCQGHEEIAAWVRSLGSAARPEREHLVANPVISGAPPEAELSARVVVVMKGPDDAPLVDYVASVVCHVRKSNGRWQIARRRLQLQSSFGESLPPGDKSRADTER
jgi:hypothetical protein